MALHRIDHLGEANGGKDRPVDASGALLGGVQEPEVERIHPNLLRQVIDHRLRGELGVRRARRAVGVRRRLVDENAKALHIPVLDVVGRKHAHAASPNHRAGVCPGLVCKHRLGRSDLALLRRSHLYCDVRTGRRAGGFQILRPSHDDLDRAVRLP